MEFIFALKEGTASSSLDASVVKMEQAEGVFVVNVEGTFPCKPKDKVPASTFANNWSPIFPFSRYAQATHAALASLGAPPYFHSLQEFQLHSEKKIWRFPPGSNAADSKLPAEER